MRVRIGRKVRRQNVSLGITSLLTGTDNDNEELALDCVLESLQHTSLLLHWHVARAESGDDNRLAVRHAVDLGAEHIARDTRVDGAGEHDGLSVQLDEWRRACGGARLQVRLGG